MRYVNKSDRCSAACIDPSLSIVSSIRQGDDNNRGLAVVGAADMGAYGTYNYN